MSRQTWFAVFVGISLLFSAACAGRSKNPTPQANLPNPASVYCEQHGGKLELRRDASGNVTGMCVFPDKSECEEWAFYRGECQPGDSLRKPTAGPTAAGPTPRANLPNPASIYCEQHGGQLELRQDAAGGVVGMCVFPDKSECDEWAYFRGECQPGAVRTATPEIAGDGWKVYRNERLGYSFHYPTDAGLSAAADPLQSLTIEGPVIVGDHWPTIFISHPGDREDYRPPEGVDLAQWLADHYLLQTGGGPTAEVRQPDVTIAGTTAIHTRLARSPQTYAYDK